MLQFTSTELFSISLNIFLAFLGIVQIIVAKKEQEKDVAKVRIWHKQAEGIKESLLDISEHADKFGNKNEMASAVLMVAQNATSLDEAFAEDRFYNDADVKAKRETKEKIHLNLFKRAKKLENGEGKK
jgi:hypothetical protein